MARHQQQAISTLDDDKHQPDKGTYSPNASTKARGRRHEQKVSESDILPVDVTRSRKKSQKQRNIDESANDDLKKKYIQSQKQVAKLQRRMARANNSLGHGREQSQSISLPVPVPSDHDGEIESEDDMDMTANSHAPEPGVKTI
ncbi:hypothetical protein BC835DRAFT_1424416 [Cytidiella melzeri]|nr:hypothetical protein BC835DRAFT_1424416 [Cytidiella melzeri]